MEEGGEVQEGRGKTRAKTVDRVSPPLLRPRHKISKRTTRTSSLLHNQGTHPHFKPEPVRYKKTAGTSRPRFLNSRIFPVLSLQPEITSWAQGSHPSPPWRSGT